MANDMMHAVPAHQLSLQDKSHLCRAICHEHVCTVYSHNRPVDNPLQCQGQEPADNMVSVWVLTSCSKPQELPDVRQMRLHGTVLHA